MRSFRLVSVSVAVASCLAFTAPVFGDDFRLIDAVKSRDATTVDSLLKSKSSVNTKRGDGTTALHWAAQWDNVPLVKRLVAAGADVNAQTDLGIAPITLACLNGSATMVETLLAAGANANWARKTGETALMTCSRTGDVKAVDALLAHGANVSQAEPVQGQDALMWAAAEGHADVVKVLIAHGAQVSGRTKNAEFTPLLFAAREGATDVVDVLLASGADVNGSSHDGTTPLLAAAFTEHWDLAKHLLAKGADPNKSDAGYTALHWAVGSWETDISGVIGPDRYEWISGRAPGKLELVQALLAKGANPNARLQKRPPRYGFVTGTRFKFPGATPFILAALGGNVSIMRALVAAGADPKATTDDGTTALMTAAGFGRVHGQSRQTAAESLESVKYVLQFGLDVNVANKAGDTALHGAAYAQIDPVVELLIASGAKLDARNLRGETPLVLAEGFEGVDTGGNTFYSDSTAAILRKAGASNVMSLSATVIKVETPCPAPSFLVSDPSIEPNERSRGGEYGTAIRIRPSESFQFKNSDCSALAEGANVRITGTRLGHKLDKNGKPWDGAIDADVVEVKK
jgi:ankyrin repeat protein